MSKEEKIVGQCKSSVSKELEALKRIETVFSLNKDGKPNAYKEYTNSIYPYYQDFNLVEQALQRLDDYEQILGNGRLTDRNYKNTTLPLDSCKPYLRLGQLEDIYEESKRCK